MLQRWHLLTAVAVALLSSTGCVTFEKETMVFTVAPDGKEVRGLLLYEGVCVDGPKVAELTQAKDQLARFAASRTEFCVGDNFIGHIDLGEQKGDSARAKAGKETFRKHLTIQPGAFFLDESGRLCGYQTVTIKEPEKLLAAVNDLVNDGLAEALPDLKANPAQGGWDEESVRLMEKAVAAKHAWVKAGHGRLSFTLPVSQAVVNREKTRLLGEKRFLELLQANPVSFDFRRDRVTVTLGLGDGEPLRLEVSNSQAQRQQQEALLDYARTLPAPFLKGRVSPEKVIKDFLEGAEKKP